MAYDGALALAQPVSISLPAEQSLVGGLLQCPDDVPLAREIVPRADWIEDATCRAVYQAILDCFAAGESADLMTVADRMERCGLLAGVGGFETLAELVGGTLPVNLLHHARAVARHGKARSLTRVGERLSEHARSAGANPSDLARAAVAALQDLAREPGDEDDELILDMAQLRARYKAQTWLCKGAIPANSIGMFFGASQTFKSFVALDLALHVAYGYPWLGRRTEKGDVLYLAAEGEAGIVKRIDAWHIQRNLDPEACPMKTVVLPLSLLTDASRLRARIERMELRPALIVVDTMSQTFSGEENSNTEVANYLRTLGIELRAPFNASVLVVHHTGHVATERPRGASAIMPNVDFLYSVWREEGEMLTSLECQKQKDDRRPDLATFSLTVVPLGNDQHGDPVTSLAARHVTDAADILRIVEQSGNADGGFGRFLRAVGTGAPEDVVREAFYKLMPDSDAEARRKAYQRAKKQAIGRNAVSIRGDWIEVTVASYSAIRG